MLVDSNAKRCPSCHSKLRRRRSQPIVLGETSRLDQQAALAVDKWNKQRTDRMFAEESAPQPAPAVVDLTEPEPELVAIVVEPLEPEPVAVVEETLVVAPIAEPIEAVLAEEVVLEEAGEVEAVEIEEVIEVDDEPEPVVVADAIAAFTLPASAPAAPEPVVALVPEPELAPEPQPVADSRSFLALALAEHEAAAARTTEPPAKIDEALDGDVTSIVDALHRKARGEAAEPVEAAEPPQVSLFDEPSVDRSDRPLRLMASTGSRRRWNRREADD